MSELFHRLAEDRLRRRSLWGGAVIALSPLWPYEVVAGQPQFLWQIAGELPPAALLAAVAPAGAGLAILVARRWSRPTTLALVVVAALLATGLCRRFGAEAAAWGLLPMPRSFTDRAALALVALGATAAGSHLSRRPATGRASRVLLFGGVVVALLFYSWPGRGAAPGETVLHNLALLGDMPSFRFQLGLLTLAVVALWPAIVTLAGLGHLRRPATSAASGVAMAALFGFPVILMMLLFSWYVRASPGAALFGALGAALEIAAVLHLLAGAGELLGEATAPPEEDDERPPWTSWPRELVAAGGTVLICATAAWWLARPPDKGVRWTLDAPTADGDAVFGERVVAWSRARAHWDRRVRSDSSATDLLEVQARERAMVEAGAALDPGIGTRLDALARAAYELDTPTRRWYRLVADVNAAVRDAQQPYYLDPRIAISKTKDGLRRRFAVDGYRVERVRRWRADGEALATLHLRPLGGAGGGHHGLLGLSRDRQPFAMVALDAAEHHASELTALGEAEPPRCGDTASRAATEASERCGQRLRELLAAPTAKEAIIGSVERHELQHQIDGPLLRLAAPLRRKLAGYADEAQERANRELSAYLAQLTAAAEPLQLGLILPFRFALLADRGTYHHAAVLTFEALADRTIRDERGRVQPDALAAVFDELSALDDAALRARATEAWERLFGDDLPGVTLEGETTVPGAEGT